MSKGTIVHYGRTAQSDINVNYESALIRSYAESRGYEYSRIPITSSMFSAAGALKTAKMVFMWSGNHWHGPLAKKLCERRGIPTCFLEHGLMPQLESFLVDPCGMCGDSVLMKDVSWVGEAEMQALYQKRVEMQAQYPLRDEGFVLVPLQIYNDSQVLYYTPFNSMEEFVSYVESIYPKCRIVVRPHPRGGKKDYKFKRAECIYRHTFLDWAAKASAIVGLTSTSLYEAAILGKPVVALGDHPLRLAANPDRVAAGALALRVPIEGGDLSTVLDRFGVRPL